MSAAWCLAAILTASVSAAPSSGLEFSSDTVVVSLARPLERDAAGGYPLAGADGLHEAIRDARVDRIDDALPRSASSPSPRFADSELARIYKLHVPAGTDIPALAAQLASIEGVSWAEPDGVVRAATTPNDVRFASQWSLEQASDHDIDATAAWDTSTGRSSVVIAIIDTGVDLFHEDFASKLTAGQDFVNNDTFPQDDHGHGTNVASIAGARTNNGFGVAGVCWACPIMPLKALNSSGSGSWTTVADALTWAADHGAWVANMSLESSAGSQTIQTAVAYAYDAGLVLTVAMGNGGSSVPHYPAAYAQTIAVGSTDVSDRRATSACGGGGSNTGAHIDVCAPGDGILGAALNGGYSSWCGTSQATPHVAGLAGLILSINPSSGREETRHLIEAGAQDQVGLFSEDTLGFDNYHGWGRINAARSLSAASASITLRVDKTPTPRVYFASPVPGASSYDFVRGDLAALSETSAAVSLGSVLCLENNSVDASTSGPNTTADPNPGQAFFYVARFNAAPGAGSYGGSSRHRDRSPVTGGCAP